MKNTYIAYDSAFFTISYKLYRDTKMSFYFMKFLARIIKEGQHPALNVI